MIELEEVQKLHKLPALNRTNSINYNHAINVTISISCQDGPIQPREGTDCLELNQIGVMLRQDIGSKI